MSSITPESLAALRVLAEKLQGDQLSDAMGPWEVHEDAPHGDYVRPKIKWVVVSGDGSILAYVPRGHWDAVGRYLSAVSPDVILGLLDELAGLRAREDLAQQAASGTVHPHRVADEDGLAWVKVLVQSAHPNTPCRLQVGFMRSLLDRLESAEQDAAYHLAQRANEKDAAHQRNLDHERALKIARAATDMARERADEHLSHWQAALEEVTKARLEVQRLKADRDSWVARHEALASVMEEREEWITSARVERDQALVRAEAAEQELERWRSGEADGE